MNVYQAKAYIEKVFKYVSTLEENHVRGPYQKTQSQLRCIREYCNLISDNISAQLGEETTESITSIFSMSDALIASMHILKFIQSIDTNNLSHPAEYQNLLNICRTICRDNSRSDRAGVLYEVRAGLESLLSYFTSTIDELDETIEKSEDSEVSFVEENPNNKIKMIASPADSSSRKDILSQYFKCIKSMSSTRIPYPVVEEFKNLLCDWFQTRFGKKDESFYYKIESLKDNVVSMVVTYGQFLAQSNNLKFLNDFRSWLDRLKCGPHKYALPFFVYDTYQNPDIKTDAFASKMIFEILKDYGMSSIILENSNVYLGPDIIDEWVSNHNVTNEFPDVDYKINPEYLKYANIY